MPSTIASKVPTYAIDTANTVFKYNAEAENITTVAELINKEEIPIAQIDLGMLRIIIDNIRWKMLLKTFIII